ncbi:acyl-CoA synthetase [Pseudonocardia sp. KRD-184]|uniref:Acyl-CoA synthetase n=1 Tax=Pseudonocardia oceani TaxID=2792013 RepID=A0ABS6U277_9PSEU|nr:acyl-CoA synthetase [Pseudonocardia oceani]MBW0089718.1 acyl-CoA synthetase [Pseudonocardia oceani]MBW0096785.1 acyl-CoA synthetase [Pseudonocardia oceani]MBW0109442.1 acyl-CoA synthetase [Pseudonocardia oceani]MBW0120830.1 acyl-CoA synthetase [Pseudonocardia oceani]MBW0126101.1 acyl-CoA synthetase [Pseudonocardia oceani]
MYPGKFAATTPDKAAVVLSDTGAVLTYAELDERSIRLSRALHDAGLRPGDDVALITENSLRNYEVFWAAMRSGLYLTAVNQNLTPSEVSYIVRDCGAKAVVSSSRYAATATAILADTPGVDLRLSFGDAAVEGHDDYEAALAAVSPEPLPEQPRGRDMLYSSGTTGVPKGIKAPLPGVSVVEGGDPLIGLFGPLYGFGDDTVYLSPAPLYHAAPLRFGGMIHQVGGTVVVMPKFEPAAALAAIERYSVTHSQWVPTMFVRMLKLPEEVRTAHDLSSHRVAVHAAAPCPVEVKQKMIEWWGPVLHEYYGATEAIGVTVIDSPTWLQHPGSVGKALLGVLHICADDGSELPTGEVGLVYFEREVLPFAYHNDPDKTRGAQHPEHPNWGTTGDVGHLDEEGFLHLTDRKAFMIISGGVNIYPQEIENALTLHPAVLDLAVVGIPDEEMGEQVKAFVQPAHGVTGSPELEAELLAFLRTTLAGYKVPRSIEFVESLPRTETGKLQKHKLRDRHPAA